MALDGIAVAHIVHELRKTLLGGKVEKIHQPETDEIIMSVKRDGIRRLLISANAQGPRLHLTAIPKENPMTAPLFCMVLRKHLMGGRIVDIAQGEGFERVVNIDIEAVSEMGEMTRNRLSAEIMGKHSNIILIGTDGVILDSIKHINHEKSSLREVLPGRVFTPPPEQDKVNPAAVPGDFPGFAERLSSSGVSVHKHLHTAYMGISPATASEMQHRAGLAPDASSVGLNEEGVKSLYAAFCEIVEDAVTGVFNGELVLDGQDVPVQFAPFALTMYGEGRKPTSSMSALLEDYYGERDQNVRVNQKSQDLRRLISQNIERCVRKHDTHERTLREIENRDVHRLYGELLTANLYRLSQGMTEVSLEDYNAADGSSVTIQLDARLTPTQNAQRWYKLYNKEKRAFEALKDQIKQNAADLNYLESVMVSVGNATGEADLNEIREELAEQGFVKRKNILTAKRAKKHKETAPLTFTSSDGFLILVGKNNRQNDELTMKDAEPADIWLHTKDIPGSHVIIKAGGKTVPDRTLEEAAKLAAYHSKARAGSLVPVDYALRKYVKKPGGAKPGAVIYTNQKTAFVKPEIIASH
ncbi:MAG: NFACT family protein [Clostridiales bacterium]|jgi:predicted ribosome quality control (RQC) complex YloA/Tae2 family protein|nr:NFACT family protein [Clostridiales bacterium]